MSSQKNNFFYFSFILISFLEGIRKALGHGFSCPPREEESFVYQTNDRQNVLVVGDDWVRRLREGVEQYNLADDTNIGTKVPVLNLPIDGFPSIEYKTNLSVVRNFSPNRIELLFGKEDDLAFSYQGELITPSYSPECLSGKNSSNFLDKKILEEFFDKCDCYRLIAYSGWWRKVINFLKEKNSESGEERWELEVGNAFNLVCAKNFRKIYSNNHAKNILGNWFDETWLTEHFKNVQYGSDFKEDKTSSEE